MIGWDKLTRGELWGLQAFTIIVYEALDLAARVLVRVLS